MRDYRLIDSAIKKFELDLSGIVVYTEAASNAYLWTPIIAAMANAKKVYAITKDSFYSTAEDVTKSTMRHARRLDVHEKIEIVRKKKSTHVSSADIITNLGFVRPIDRSMINWIKQKAVICLMWEPWEYRQSDLDIAECYRRNLNVLGTNERDSRLMTFKYVGVTVLKLLLENHLEVLGSRILLLGSGAFVSETKACLIKNGADVVVKNQLNGFDKEPYDCVVCLEHHNHQINLISDDVNFNLDRSTTFEMPLIIHICGKIDKDAIRRRKWHCIPERPAEPGRMSFTTAYVGSKPVIDLHTAGLRVGQAYLQKDKKVLDALSLEL